MFAGDELPFPGRLPFWGVYRYSWIWKAEKGATRDASIMLRQKDDPKVAVLASAEVALN